MKSLKSYYLLISGITIFFVLVISTFVFIFLFGQNLERRIHADLTHYVNQISAEITFDDKGDLQAPTGLSDLRFDTAYSGLYWQIDDPEMHVQLRSRSLWDYILPLPKDSHDVGEIHRYKLPGPDNTVLIVQERTLVVAAPAGARTIRIGTAMDRAAITDASTEFLIDLFPFLVVLGAILAAASYIQFSIGLRPLASISDNLDAIRDRQARRLDGPFPSEVQRLIDAVNNLLASQEEAFDKARKRSGDLAHGLKTPLTVIKNNANSLINQGDAQTGEEIAAQVQDMESHIQFELLRSRLAPSPEQRTSDSDVIKVVSDIVKTLQKTPDAEKIAWVVEMPLKATIAIDSHDLRELLGNVIENSSKWAQHSVQISGSKEADGYHLTIEDDGPGLEHTKISSMMERGKRFDEKVGGTGIGLSIVREICDLYRLPINIQNRQASGLSVSLVLPLV